MGVHVVFVSCALQEKLEPMIHTVHRRRNQGEVPGAHAPPPPPSWEGGQCPHSQIHAYPCCTRPNYEISYKV